MNECKHIYYDYIRPYLAGESKVKLVKRDIAKNEGITRDLMMVQGQQYKFISVSIDINKLERYKDVSTEVRVYKCKMPAFIKVSTEKEGIVKVPIMFLTINCSNITDCENVLVDFSDSDMCNMKHISFECKNKTGRYPNIGFKFPHGVCKPELYSISCSSYNIDITSIVEELDLSSVIGMWGFMANADITEFDFDKLNIPNAEDFYMFFDGCDKLKLVYGKIGTNAREVKLNGMFTRCTSLEHIGAEVFDNVKVEDASHMFYGLRRSQNSMAVDTVLGILESSYRHKITCCMDGAFDNMTGGVTVGKHSIKYESLRSIFMSTDLDFLDLRKVEFNGESISIADMCNEFLSAFGGWLNPNIVKNIVGNGLGLTDTKLPRIIIVNNRFKITETDLSYYDVLDIGKLSDEELNIKIGLLKVMDNGKNYILRCSNDI